MPSSIDDIKDCTACPLHKFQAPLLDIRREANVIWVGLSAKLIDNTFATPLDLRSRSGKLIQSIEDELPSLTFYSTNLVKCAPINEGTGKLRYPSPPEIEACQMHLSTEVNTLQPQCIVLLGSIVAKSVLRVLNISDISLSKDYAYTTIKSGERHYLFAHHPSYISIYRRGDVETYKNGIKAGILQSLNQ